MSIFRVQRGYIIFDHSGHYMTITRERLGFVLRDDHGELYDVLSCADVSYAARRAYEMASWYLRRQNWAK